MATGNGPPPYTISVSGVIRERIRELARFAIRVGQRGVFFDAFRDVIQQLQYTPGPWGDQLRDYKHAGLSEYRAMQPVFIVHYGIHEASRTVFIRDVRLNPYSDLANMGDV